MTTTTPLYGPEPGRAAAFVTYALYLLSIPSAGILALVGLVVAYVGLRDSVGVARTHLEDAIRIWWIAFWWAVGLGVLSLVGWILSVIIIGFPLIALALLVGFLVMAWFTVTSFFSLLALLDGRAR